MRKLTIVGAASALMLSIGPAAEAGLVTVGLQDGATFVSCADGAACDTNALPGVVTFTATFASVTVALSGTGSGPPAAIPYTLDITYNVTTLATAAAGTDIISVSLQDFAPISGISWTGHVGGTNTNGSIATFQSFADAGNTLFGLTTSTCGPVTSGASPFALTCAGGVQNFLANFSQTEVITVVRPNGGITSATGDALQTPSVPEPGTLALLGAALLSAAGFRRRRKS